MLSNSLKERNYWWNLIKRRGTVEKFQIDKIIHCTVPDLCKKAGVNRSDSGFDGQSLIMDGHRPNDCDLNQDLKCSTVSIEKIVNLTVQIRDIEQRIGVTKRLLDLDSETRGNHYKLPDVLCMSRINNELMRSSIELEKINNQLNYCHNELFEIANVKMFALFDGVSSDQLKKRINKYYKLKTKLSELASTIPCNSASMIALVEQLEPIAESVENYFRLSDEAKYIYNQITTITQRKTALEKKQCQLLKMAKKGYYDNTQTNALPNLFSFNDPGVCSQYRCLSNYPWTDDILLSKKLLVPEINHSDSGMCKDITGVSWSVFNGDYKSESNLPLCNERVPNTNKDSGSHTRSSCHQYINDDSENNPYNQDDDQLVELMVSPFPDQSVLVIQVKNLRIYQVFDYQCQVRLFEYSGNSSDWMDGFTTSKNDDDGRRHISISPYIMMPVKWDFQSKGNLMMMLEMKIIDKDHGQTSRWFEFNIEPSRIIDKLLVPLFIVEDVEKIQFSRKSNKISVEGQSGIPSSQPALNKMRNDNKIPARSTGIRRSQTYSNDRRCNKSYTNSSLTDIKFEPLSKIRLNNNNRSQPLYPSSSIKTFDSEIKFQKQPGRLSNSSSFTRNSTFRHPIRLKRNSMDESADTDQHNQLSGAHIDNSLIEELWTVIHPLHTSLISCLSNHNAMMEFSNFQRICPPDVKILYDYFVHIIFDCDNGRQREQKC